VVAGFHVRLRLTAAMMLLGVEAYRRIALVKCEELRRQDMLAVSNGGSDL
jgi:hypothetical protein